MRIEDAHKVGGVQSPVDACGHGGGVKNVIFLWTS